MLVSRVGALLADSRLLAAGAPADQATGEPDRPAASAPGPESEPSAETAGDVWALLDHEEGTLSKVSLQLLTAARSLAAQAGGSPVAVFCGTGWERAKEAVARYFTVTREHAEAQRLKISN